MRVLIVEDESRLAENIAEAFREGPGFAVDVCHDGEEALLACGAVEYDLIVLDLMLPKQSGSKVLQALRAKGCQTPVLVLTAVSEVKSTIDLLNLGADDYMTKPFDLGELIARARALVRRGKGLRQTSLTYGGLTLDFSAQTVTANDRQIELSPTEYRILEYLMHHPRKIVSKRELLEHLYDFTWEHHSNVVEAHISNLRRKLRGATPQTVVENVRGRGYRLSQRDEFAA
ncbi:MAG: response regulator transcription factor [Deltaproteobacteria bacterium]|nr:response regulator transcription factor [Deltaproteobacteria bacterium]